jgi:nickel-dependent lactate racemase
VAGEGAPDATLSGDSLRAIVARALDGVPADARVLAIIPDKTRDDNTPLLLPLAAQFLAQRGAAKLDALIAQGTHAPMSDAEKRAKTGAGAGLPLLGQVFDHQWNSPDDLTTIGELSAARVATLTNGLLDEAVPLTVNRLLTPGLYDTVLLFGGTMPHEVAGYAGGAKYFFPGVSGPELTHATHWLGALAGVEQTIGRVETPTRHLIEAAAESVKANIIAFVSVCKRETKLQTRALFAGDYRLALRRAAAVSSRVHIRYTGRKYKRVVALLDEHYDEMWTGGKASYRLGPVIEEGGELVIYAPHLRCWSDTHGALIERYGYAPLETVREMMAHSPELRANRCVAAHLAHVAFASRRDTEGRILPRYRITLASQISAEECRRVNLNYLHVKDFRRADDENKADTLIVENAGRDLYLPDELTPRHTY